LMMDRIRSETCRSDL